MFTYERIYGRDGLYNSPYLTRIGVGRLYLHIFHRGDQDPDCHDHPWPFWTFPLKDGYYEEVLHTVPAGKTEYYRHHVYQAGETYLKRVKVRPWRWHYRPAEYKHRVLFPARASAGFFDCDPEVNLIEEAKAKQAYWPIITLVWHGPKTREWGFWKDGVLFIPWRRYIFKTERPWQQREEENSNG